MSSSFLAELKRRRVVRVALVYGAVSSAVVQAADVFVPALALPAWILTAVAMLALLGFPVALVRAWAYDPAGRGRRIFVAGGNNPQWSRSGQTLFFRNGQNELEQVRVGSGPELEVLERSVHPAPGDSLFIGKDETGPRASARPILVRNWARELAARAEEAW